MKKLILLLIILILPLISAIDSELFIPCGFGDQELYVGCLGDEQGVSAFWGQDFIPPVITLTSPIDGTQDTDGVVRFTFTPSDANIIDNCSLIYQDGVYTTSTSISNGISNVIEVVGIDLLHPLFRDDLQWRIDCTDEFNNKGASETRHLDTKEDDVEDPGGGGGITVLQNPKRMDLFYPEIWHRNSEVKLILKIYNLQNKIYEPPIIELNFTISGIELKESEVGDFLQIINTFKISNDAKLGEHKMEIIVTDERTIKQTIEFEIVREDYIEKEVKDYGLNIIFWIIVAIIFLTIIAIILLIYKKKKK